MDTFTIGRRIMGSSSHQNQNLSTVSQDNRITMARWWKFHKAPLICLTLAWVALGAASRLDAAGAASPVYAGDVATLRNKVRFPTLESKWLKDDFAAIAEFTFKSNAKFDATQLGVALNGLRSDTRYGKIAGFTRWEQRQGRWVLIVEIGRLTFGGRSFASRAAEIQSRSRHVKVWISACPAIGASQIYFVRHAEWFAEPVLSWVAPMPETSVNTRDISFHFKSSDKAARIQCRFDTGDFTPCESGVRYTSLANGWHRFSARPVAPNGKFGKILTHDFSVFYVSPPAEIVQTIPAESPTPSSTMEIHFKRNWTLGSGTVTQCKLDSGKFQTCQSPIVYKNLPSGEHRFEVRLALSLPGVLTTSRSDSYSWTVSRTPVVAEWVSTPALLSNSDMSRFEFRAQQDGVKFSCALDGAAEQDCVSPYVLEGLNDGAHVLRVTARDIYGTVSAPLEHRWEIDREAPVLSLVAVTPQHNPTNASTLAITYTASEPSRTECRWNGVLLQNCASPLILNSVPEGHNQVEWIAKDAAGNVSEPLSYSWDVDFTPPSASVALTFPTSIPTRETSARFALTANQTSTFECTLDGAAIASCSADLSLSGLSDGAHTLSVTAVDEAGNGGAPVVFQWTVDRVAPVLSVVAANPPESITMSTSLALDFLVSEEAVTTCELDAGGEAPCSSPYVLNGLAEGKHVIELRATDTAGNNAPVLAYEWEVVGVALAQLTEVIPHEALTRSKNIRFEYASAQSTRFECALDSAAFSVCQSPSVFNALGEGNHRFQVRALNAANVAGPVVSYDWIVDTVAPIAQWTAISPPEAITEQTQISLSFAAPGAVSHTCQLDSAAAVECQSPLVANGLSEGTHQVTVLATDAAGNRSAPLTYQWQIAGTAVATIEHTVPSASLTNSKSMQIAFSAPKATRFECALDTAPYATCTSPVLYTRLNDGAHQFQVRAINAAAIAGPIAAYQWTVHTVPPVVQIQSATPGDSLTSQKSMSLAFSALGATAFQCRLDLGASNPCQSPAIWNGLSDGDHTVTILATDAAGNQSAPATHSWRVQSAPLSIASVSVQQIMRTSVVIRWSTNFPARGRVEYGTGGFDQSTAITSTDTTAQSLTVSGLTSDTVYRARVVVVDRDGRTVTSSPVTFTTLR